MEETEKRLAILIDSENISTKYIKCIIDEVSNYGIATYKRAYGDWTSARLNGWKEMFLKFAITPIQQYSYTQGKNSTDSAMIIDAMDILYTGRVDGFCIVSSDSDFTKLAGRLREAGMLVIGMGEKKTVEAFRTSCTLFKYLEVLASDDADENSEDLVSRDELEDTIRKIIMDNDIVGRDTTVGEIGSKLSNLHSDFDVRNYGYSKLSKFLESFRFLNLEQHGRSIMVSMAGTENNREDIEKFVREAVGKTKGRKMNLATLKQKIVKQFPSFNIRDYEYSKFSRFINDMNGMNVDENTVRMSK